MSMARKPCRIAPVSICQHCKSKYSRRASSGHTHTRKICTHRGEPHCMGSKNCAIEQKRERVVLRSVCWLLYFSIYDGLNVPPSRLMLFGASSGGDLWFNFTGYVVVSGPSIVAALGIVRVWGGRATHQCSSANTLQNSSLHGLVVLVAAVSRKLFIDSAFMSQSPLSSLPH